MIDKLEIRRRRKESLITISFSIFSVLLIYVAVATGWSPAIVPVIAGELGFAWWAHVNSYRNYEVRAFIVTVFACINITFYGIYAENFLVIIPTLCVFAVLFSLYEIVTIYYIVIINSFFLFFYHLFVSKSFVISDVKVERERMVLQLLSYFILLLLCQYRIRSSEQREKDMADLQQVADNANKIRDDFVANTSHELRTPINTITGMSEILLQEDLSEEIHHEVLDIQMTGYELQNIVTDILDYAALESKTLQLNPRSYNITSTINDVMNMTVFQNKEKNLELIFDCDPRIPRLLYGDEAQLRRVINNLIGNAIKFTNEGGVKVEVGFRPETYGINLIVKVKDTGIGMDLDQQERIFQSFYQADSDRNRRVEGMGLGLTISSELIKKMGGFMYATSVIGKGSEFIFSVPQSVVDDRPCIEVNNPSRIKTIWYYSSKDDVISIRDDFVDHIKHMADYLKIYVHRCSSLNELKRRIKQNIFTHLIIGTKEYNEEKDYFNELAKSLPVILVLDRDEDLPENNAIHILYKPYNSMTLAEIFNGGDILRAPKKYHELEKFVAPDAKVLVVDDNLMNLKVVEGLLRKYRIRIAAASSGDDALNVVESQDFDFIFMDHMMPGMDGIECLHAIRRKQGTYYQRVPIIALTANAIAGSREMFLAEGFNDFVAKPIDNGVLDDVLRKYIPKEKQIIGDNNQNIIEDDNDIFKGMDGISKDVAMTYCGGSINDYIDLANIYYETGLKYYDDLIRYYDQKDWKNYAIIAHSIKSTSKTLGAIDLSDLAYKEEMASKQEEIETIDKYHEALLKEYSRVLELLANNPKIIKTEIKEENIDSKNMTLKKWKEFTDELKDKIDTFETSSIKDVVEKYKHYKFHDQEIEDLIKPIIDKIENFDFEGSKEDLNKIIDNFKGKKV